MTQIPGAHIETTHTPAVYSQYQIDQACAVAADLDRGKLVLTIAPSYDCDTTLGPGRCGYCTWHKENEAA